MVLMFFAGVSIYFGTITEHKYMSAALLSFAGGFLRTIRHPHAGLLQGMIRGKNISAASGVMNNVANGLSSLSPVFIGILFLSLELIPAAYYARFLSALSPWYRRVILTRLKY